MSRIKIDITGKLLATVTLPVRITDINYGNHTGNDSIVGLIQEARMIWLQQYRYTELDIDGTGLIMSDLAMEFKNESFYGDILEIQLFVGEITKKSFELYYAITTIRDQTTLVIARAKTGMVCFDYGQKKVALIPDSLMNKLT